MDKAKPLSHTEYLAEQIETWSHYLNHADIRARLIGLRMIRNEINYLMTREWEGVSDRTMRKITRFTKTIRERIYQSGDSDEL